METADNGGPLASQAQLIVVAELWHSSPRMRSRQSNKAAGLECHFLNICRHQVSEACKLATHTVPGEGEETSRRMAVTLPDRSCLLPTKAAHWQEKGWRR